MLESLDIGQITADPHNPRSKMDKEELAKLAKSIEQFGIIHPILVDNNNRVIDGHRRFAAAKLSKLKKISVIKLPPGDGISEADRMMMQLVSNQFHSHLRPSEIANHIHRMRHNKFASDNEIFTYMNKLGIKTSKKELEALFMVALLDHKYQAALDDGRIGVSAAYAIRDALHLLDGHKKMDEAKVAIKKGIDEDIRDPWRRPVGEHTIYSIVYSALKDEAHNLDATNSWDPDPVHFNWKRICKRRKCPSLLIVKDRAYCINSAGFAEQQAKAKQAGLEPGGKKPAKAPPTAEEQIAQTAKEKELTRSEQIYRRIRKNLSDQLSQKIKDELLHEDKRTLEVRTNLAAFLAMDCPANGPQEQSTHPEKREARIDAGLYNLTSFMIESASRPAAVTVAACSAINALGTEELVYLAKVWIDHQYDEAPLSRWWEPDDDYCSIFRKQEIIDGILSQDKTAATDKKKMADLRAMLKENYDLYAPGFPWIHKYWESIKPADMAKKQSYWDAYREDKNGDDE